jgi:pyridoxine kinase
MAILSIQSHVVYGYAGNTAAVLPMQRLGHEVWAINTVEFSNHTGYGSWKGKVLGAELTSELVLGLEERGVLDRCGAVVSGYLGDAAVCGTIADAVKKVRQFSPDALYCCDPVMGDAGRGIYVKPDIPNYIRNDLLPLADILCPNQFELELLTGMDTSTMPDAVKAINILHDKGPSVVLVTSFKEKKDDSSVINILVSDKSGIYKVSTPELPLGTGVAGTGDMTTAIFLSRFLETRDIQKTLELCVSSVYGILEYSLRNSIKGRLLELKIVEAQAQLNSPSLLFNAVKVIR